MVALFAVLLLAVLAPTVASPAQAAPEAPTQSDDITLPYLQSDQRELPKGWTVTGCPDGRLPNLVTVTCADDTVQFTAADFARGVRPQKVRLTIAKGAEKQTLTYRVGLQGPEIIAPEAALYDVPLGQGTPSTIPYSTFAYTCQGCSKTGPTFGSATVSPKRAGTLSFSGSGLVFQPAPDFEGRATLGYRIEDRYGQQSDPTTLRVSVVPGMTHAPTMAASSATTKKDVSVAGNVTTDDTPAKGYPLTLSVCGKPANGTVTCGRDGSFVYHPSQGFTGVDQFSYLVYSDRSGDQAAGSVVVGVGTDPMSAVAATLSSSRISRMTPAPNDQNG